MLNNLTTQYLQQIRKPLEQIRFVQANRTFYLFSLAMAKFDNDQSCLFVLLNVKIANQFTKFKISKNAEGKIDVEKCVIRLNKLITGFLFEYTIEKLEFVSGTSVDSLVQKIKQDNDCMTWKRETVKIINDMMKKVEQYSNNGVGPQIDIGPQIGPQVNPQVDPQVNIGPQVNIDPQVDIANTAHCPKCGRIIQRPESDDTVFCFTDSRFEKQNIVCGTLFKFSTLEIIPRQCPVVQIEPVLADFGTDINFGNKNQASEEQKTNMINYMAKVLEIVSLERYANIIYSESFDHLEQKNRFKNNKTITHMLNIHHSISELLNKLDVQNKTLKLSQAVIDGFYIAPGELERRIKDDKEEIKRLEAKKEIILAQHPNHIKNSLRCQEDKKKIRQQIKALKQDFVKRPEIEKLQSQFDTEKVALDVNSNNTDLPSADVLNNLTLRIKVAKQELEELYNTEAKFIRAIDVLTDTEKAIEVQLQINRQELDNQSYRIEGLKLRIEINQNRDKLSNEQFEQLEKYLVTIFLNNELVMQRNQIRADFKIVADAYLYLLQISDAKQDFKVRNQAWFCKSAIKTLDQIKELCEKYGYFKRQHKSSWDYCQYLMDKIYDTRLQILI